MPCLQGPVSLSHVPPHVRAMVLRLAAIMGHGGTVHARAAPRVGIFTELHGRRMALADWKAFRTHGHTASKQSGRRASGGPRREAGRDAGHSSCFSPERARHSTLEQDDQLSQPGRQPLEVLDAPFEAIVSSTFNKVIDDRAQRLSAVAQVADGAVVKAAGVEGGDAQDIGRVRLGFAKKACGWAAAALRRNLCERNFPGTVLTPPPQPVGRVGQCTHEEISHRRF